MVQLLHVAMWLSGVLKYEKVDSEVSVVLLVSMELSKIHQPKTLDNEATADENLICIACFYMHLFLLHEHGPLLRNALSSLQLIPQLYPFIAFNYQ